MFRGIIQIISQITTVCQNQLGIEDGRITDSQITASSMWNSNLRPSYGRLNRPTGSWGSQTTDSNQWIQVDFRTITQVSGVMTQGRNEDPQWVKEFKVQYSLDGVNWQYVKTANGQGDQVRT